MILAPLRAWHIAIGQLALGRPAPGLRGDDLPRRHGRLRGDRRAARGRDAPGRGADRASRSRRRSRRSRATRQNDNAFAALFRFVITPMFIFSGTFFPVTQLPDLLESIAYLDAALARRGARRAIAIDAVDPVLALVNVLVLTALPRSSGLACGVDLHAEADGVAVSLAARILPAACHRREPRPPARRAQPARLPALVDHPRLGLLRAALLPARASDSAWARSSGTSATSRTRPSSRPASWRPRR